MQNMNIKKNFTTQQTNHAPLMMLKNKEKRGTIHEKQRKLVHKDVLPGMELDWTY